MTDKEKIRKYLENVASGFSCDSQVATVIRSIILPHIDSLQEEPVTSVWHDYSVSKMCPRRDKEETVSEDMEKAAKVYEQTRNDLDVVSDNQMVERAFQAGANWQKDKLIKDAIEGYVDQLEFPDKTWIELSATPKDLKDGDEVKLIVLKEDKV